MRADKSTIKGVNVVVICVKEVRERDKQQLEHVFITLLIRYIKLCANGITSHSKGEEKERYKHRNE